MGEDLLKFAAEQIHRVLFAFVVTEGDEHTAFGFEVVVVADFAGDIAVGSGSNGVGDVFSAASAAEGYGTDERTSRTFRSRRRGGRKGLGGLRRWAEERSGGQAVAEVGCVEDGREGADKVFGGNGLGQDANHAAAGKGRRSRRVKTG